MLNEGTWGLSAWEHLGLEEELHYIQIWLHQVYKIYVSISFNDHRVETFYYFIHTDTSRAHSNRVCSLPRNFGTPEEALTEALHKALQLIKK